VLRVQCRLILEIVAALAVLFEKLDGADFLVNVLADGALFKQFVRGTGVVKGGATHGLVLLVRDVLLEKSLGSGLIPARLSAVIEGSRRTDCTVLAEHFKLGC